jgi:hypothetical protein
MTALMPMPEIERATEGDDPADEAELAAAAFLARYQGRTLDAYRYHLRVFPVGGRRPPRHPQGHAAPDRAVRAGHGGPWSGGDDHRPAAVDRLRLLPLRPH